MMIIIPGSEFEHPGVLFQLFYTIIYLFILPFIGEENKGTFNLLQLLGSYFKGQYWKV